ncbi:kinase-like domain-containing protein [Mycotypha africana]|uniref:kinase-like domain-containing protein n=1 Tax=Mycotypha africana TaxID=64632 RepID=UPI002300A442|nr:kinase-like domain-containing protein [Mycotypha africana]KAI8987926.1 kinase-like domain-containing protein [Mycotypha africana]
MDTYTKITSPNSDAASPMIEQQRYANDAFQKQQLQQQQQEINATVSDRALRNHLLNPSFLRKYTLGHQELGHGGFGFVVTCFEKLTGIERAVKFIVKDKLPSVNWVQCPLTGNVLPLEIYALKSVKHPNIIQFLDYYEDPIYFYLVMEIHGSQWQHQEVESITTTSSSETNVSYATTSDLSDHPPPPELSESKSTTTMASGRSSNSSSSMISSSSSSNSDNDDFDEFEAKDNESDEMSNNHMHYKAKSDTINRSPMTSSVRQFVRRTSCDLFECIEQHKQFEEPLAKYIFKQVVDCVAYLEYVGLCHRDIKDENIVIDKDYKVKLIDFGSAVLLPKEYTDARHYFTRFYGTLSFASPEILLSQPYKAEPAEIWSLGILLFTLIFGEIPFPDTQSALRGCMIQPRSASTASPPLVETISLECQHLIQLLLQRDPEKRPTIHQVLNHPWFKRH